jgi:hypothetical protein
MHDILIIAWKSISPRTRLLAKALNKKILLCDKGSLYINNFIESFRYIKENRPKIVIIQLPQGPLLLFATLIKLFYGIKIVADVHSGFLLISGFKSAILNMPFKFLLRYCDLIILHNKQIIFLISTEIRKKSIIVYDPWYYLDKNQEDDSKIDNYLVFPCSFHPDEPIKEILESIKNYEIGYKIYITGRWHKKPNLKKFASENIIFTGYLSNKDYKKLINSSHAIITGTKREYTVLMSAWEALAYKKPLILSKTITLKNLFGRYPLYYDLKDPESIRNAITQTKKFQINKSSWNNLKKKTLNSVKFFKNLLNILIKN